jgi:hypothetical protein
MPISVDKEMELVKIVAALKDTDQGTLAAVTAMLRRACRLAVSAG